MSSALALAFCASILSSCGNAEKSEQQKTQPTNGVALRFTDATASAGLSEFRHVTGAIGDKWFPESMGSGGGMG